VEDEEAVVEAAVEEGAVMVKNVLGKMVREPQYGGTIHYRLRPSNTEHFDWIWWDANAMCSIIYDRINTVPWERGPAGTNENPINYTWYTEEWYGCELAGSFEAVDLRTCRYTLKPGLAAGLPCFTFSSFSPFCLGGRGHRVPGPLAFSANV